MQTAKRIELVFVSNEFYSVCIGVQIIVCNLDRLQKAVLS